MPAPWRAARTSWQKASTRPMPTAGAGASSRSIASARKRYRASAMRCTSRTIRARRRCCARPRRTDWTGATSQLLLKLAATIDETARTSRHHQRDRRARGAAARDRHPARDRPSDRGRVALRRPGRAHPGGAADRIQRDTWLSWRARPSPIGTRRGSSFLTHQRDYRAGDPNEDARYASHYLLD